MSETWAPPPGIEAPASPAVASDPGDAQSPLRSTLTGLAEGVAAAAALVGWRERDVDVVAAVGQVARLRSAVEGVYLALVREAVDRGVAQASPVATSPEGLVRSATLVGPAAARRDVAAAVALGEGRPLAPFAEELAAGRVTRAHVDRAVRCLDQVPEHVLSQPGAGEQVADYLLTAAADASPRELERAGRQLLARLAPEREDRFDERAHERRLLDYHTDDTGMVVGRFQLDPVTGASFRAALEHHSGPVTGADGEPDRREPRQRRADALQFVVETALGVATPRRGERPRVVLTLTPEQLGSAGAGLGHLVDGQLVPAWAARRLACDAVLERVLVSDSLGPLDVGRSTRVATLAQRRALAVRDGGCVIPGCTAAPDSCDAHHVVHWADGGATDLANLVLLCPGHHTAVHTGTWTVTLSGSIPDLTVLITPPRWIDPAQRPRPAPRQQAARLSHRLHQHGGQQPDDSCRDAVGGAGGADVRSPVGTDDVLTGGPLVSPKDPGQATRTRAPVP